MKREEIISILRKEVDNYNYSLFHSDLEQADKEILQKKIDALDKAIKALEQESCEDAEDAISREQAIDAVADLFEMSEYPHPYPQGKPIRLKDIKEKLKQLPPVQPKYNTDEWCKTCSEYNHEKHCCPRYNKVIRNAVEEMKESNIRTAEWVLLDECSNSGYYCSHCHKKLVKEGWSGTVKKIKYCPNCGVKMINVPDINDGKLSEIPTGSESEDKE